MKIAPFQVVVANSDAKYRQVYAVIARSEVKPNLF